MLCSGGAVGTDESALEKLGGKTVLHMDIRREYLEWQGHKAIVWKHKDRRALLRRIAEHDYDAGPCRVAANLQRGWYVPNVSYDADVGTLQGAATHPGNDLNCILKRIRARFPSSRLIVLASPPCRMTSYANTASAEEDRKEYLNLLKHFLVKLRYAKEFGKCDAVLVECSAKGTTNRAGDFVPGKDAQRMLDALNCADNPGSETFAVKRVDAADYGSPSTRKRLLFAHKTTFDYLPDALDAWRGWGPVLGASMFGFLRLVRGTWMNVNFAGIYPCDPAPTLTGHQMYKYADRRDVDAPVLVKLHAADRAKLLGVRADDHRLDKLMQQPSQFARMLTGITFSVQWYNAVLIASVASLRPEACACQTQCYHDRAHANRVFWEVENQRMETHPPADGRFQAKWHALFEDVQTGIRNREFQGRLARLTKNA